MKAAYLLYACVLAIAPIQAVVSEGRSIEIINPHFEKPALSPAIFTTQNDPRPIIGWDYFDPNHVIRPVADPRTGHSTIVGVWHPLEDAYPKGVTVGKNVAYLYVVDPPGPRGVAIRQILKDKLEPHTTYVLQVDVGNPKTDPDRQFNVDGFPGYRIELRAGDRLLAADDSSFVPEEGAFQTATVKYTASGKDIGIGKPLEIRLINPMRNPGIECDFANVRLTAEPVQ